jgi:hypothetical protein
MGQKLPFPVRLLLLSYHFSADTLSALEDNSLELMTRRTLLSSIKQQPTEKTVRFLMLPDLIFLLTLSITANEIESLRKEAVAIRDIRATLGEPGAAKRVFDKVGKCDSILFLLF